MTVAPNTGPQIPTPHPLRSAAIVIYATFALLIVAIPQSVVNWAEDKEIGPVQQVLLRGAEAVQALSESAGIPVVYREMRAVFLALTGKAEN